MKTTKATWLKWLFLCVTLVGVFPAHAYYDPGAQRWLNRDPIGEEWFRVVLGTTEVGEVAEGPNLFAFVANDGVNYYDDYGNGKRPARNRDRIGHGGNDETKGGSRGDKHSRAKGHGGREKPNFKRAPSNRCGPGAVAAAVWIAIEEINNELPPAGPTDKSGNCPCGRKVTQCILWWCWEWCEPPCPPMT